MSLKDIDTCIPVIDLFAGPGGLGEGFSAFCYSNGQKPFKIALSIEKENNAHSTLELRAFFREFPKSNVPKEYYLYLRGEITRNNLFDLYREQAEKARKCAQQIELGGEKTSRDDVDYLIKDAINNNPIWVLIGGPPCQAYSVAGRSRMKNHIANFEEDQRHTLYREYLRIVAINKPPVFVMENVKGILSSKVEGENTFNKILHDLRCPWAAIAGVDEIQITDNYLNYRIYSLVKRAQDNKSLNPKDYVIKSEKYGIPQKRHRVILLGIRSDYKVHPDILTVAPEQITIEKAISDLPEIRSGVSKEKDSYSLWKEILSNISTCNWINDEIIDAKLRKEIISQAAQIDGELSLGSPFLPIESRGGFDPQWFFDGNLKGICNHVARKHMRSDLYRYFFASCFSMLNKRSPVLGDFPRDLLPNHKNVNSGIKGEMFSDRFRVQISDEPSTTIMSHISKDGHYYIYHKPSQCRSLTVREAARLQTFPDNYFFEGNQTAQYHQVGNAVPPLLARQIANIVFGTITQYLNSYIVRQTGND